MIAPEPPASLELLHLEVGRLSAVNKFYLGLYRDHETIGRMNALAGTGFRLIQDALVHDLVRSVCALCDPPQSQGRPNLSLRGLLDETPEPMKLRVEPQLSETLKKLMDCYPLLKAHRDKRLMHFDLRTKQTKYSELPALLVEHFDQAIGLVQESASLIRQAWGLPPMMYDWIIGSNDAAAISWALSDSERLSKLRAMATSPACDKDLLLRMLRQRSSRNDPIT